ncbi:MAG TPA: GNAT family N-acetyltransferase [Mycobacteriales bacterium]|nr:GNAT family N-acetyltransferase [Mycobacteriales bacterium]
MTGTLTEARRDEDPAGLELLADTARQGAEAAAMRTGVTVRLVATQEDARRASALFDGVWGREQGRSAATPELTWALAHAGNYVSIAELGGQVVGASLAFRAEDGRGAYLHSHLAGVEAQLQGRNVGFTLKLHQRWWALAHGLDRVVWTFDPLVARNAYFNIVKLGAEIASFYENFYGILQDSLNSGDLSDRCLVVWELPSARAAAACDGMTEATDVERLCREGIPTVLRPGPDGGPVQVSGQGDSLLCQVPLDIVALRASGPARAREWRLALRSVLGRAFEAGYRVTGANRDGWYLLSR